jgi:uncharacterized membrane protein YgcG
MATSIRSISNAASNPSSITGGNNPISKAQDTAKDVSGEAKNTVNRVSGIVQNTIDDISGAVADPFGTIIIQSLNRINSLTVNIQKKVDQLIKEVAQKTDSKGRISLKGDSLIITVRREDLKQAEELKKRITDKITSINKTISILNKLITSLIAIQTAITLYKTLLDIQEISLSLNPVTGPIFKVLKKGIKVVFLKEMIKQYAKLIGRQLLQNQQILNTLISRFRSIQVSVKIQDESEEGNFINTDTAENLLADDLLNSSAKGNTGTTGTSSSSGTGTSSSSGTGTSSSSGTNTITTDSQDFTDYKFNEYVLKVEKQGEKQIIGRAYEKYSGLIKAQTAPTFLSSPDELMEELKTILNLQP